MFTRFYRRFVLLIFCISISVSAGADSFSRILYYNGILDEAYFPNAARTLADEIGKLRSRKPEYTDPVITLTSRNHIATPEFYRKILSQDRSPDLLIILGLSKNKEVNRTEILWVKVDIKPVDKQRLQPEIEKALMALKTFQPKEIAAITEKYAKQISGRGNWFQRLFGN